MDKFTSWFSAFSFLLWLYQLFLEEIAHDIQKADPEWSIILLRYFNPVGAHESGRIGEDPKGIPNNLMPYIHQVAVARLPELNVYGHDYPTKDGSAVSRLHHDPEWIDLPFPMFLVHTCVRVTWRLVTNLNATLVKFLTINFNAKHENLVIVFLFQLRYWS